MLNGISFLFVCMAKLVIFKEAMGQIDQLPQPHSLGMLYTGMLAQKAATAGDPEQ